MQCQEPWLKLLDHGVYKIPDAGTLSKWRVLIDAAHMNYLRKSHDEQETDAFVRYMMFDASEQCGRHFECILVLEVMRANLASLLAAASDLANLWVHS